MTQKMNKAESVVKKNLWLVAFIACALQLVGCATQGPTETAPPVVEKSEPVVKPDINKTEPAPVVTPPAIVLPPKPSAPLSNAVASLLKQARGQYAAKNYQGAVATAERGLRIDRRAPELYLLLAQSYVQLANIKLAQQFIQQGIRYSQAGSDIAQSLVSLRDSITN